MTLFPALASRLAGGGRRAGDHLAVFRDFALCLACMAASGRRSATGARRRVHRSGSRKAS